MTKIVATRQLAREWSNAVLQQRSTLGEKEYQAAIKELTAESQQFKSELDNTNRMIAQLPRYRNRFATTLAYQQYDDLNLYKTQLQWEINQRTTFLNQLKSQKVDPKAKEKLDATVRDRSDALHQAVMDLRKLVETTEEKYKALAKDGEVKKYQDSSEHKTGIKLHLGPSRQFHLDVKILEKLEKEASGGESREPGPEAREEDASIDGRKTIVQVVGRIGRFEQPILTPGSTREPGSSISKGRVTMIPRRAPWALGSFVLAVAAAGGVLRAQDDSPGSRAQGPPAQAPGLNLRARGRVGRPEETQ